MNKPQFVRLMVLVAATCTAGAVAQPVSAVTTVVTEINGRTYSIANGFTARPDLHTGSHFHSSNDSELPATNPDFPAPALAEVGGFYGDEEIRGVSEFNLSSSPAAVQALLLFDTVDVGETGLGLTFQLNVLGGLYDQPPYTGLIDVFAYDGDGIEDLSDFQIPTLGDTPIAQIDASLLSPRQTLQFDVTDLYNSARNSASRVLGIRLQIAPPADRNSGAMVFNNFRIAVVPEPQSIWLFVIGCAAFSRRKR